MTELTLNAQGPAPAETLIFEVGLKNFVKEVIEASQTQLVIVDFWAPWCGPCKQLVPILERVIPAMGGVARLAKINIDEAPQIAQQMGVQSVPTVFAFYNKQPVDGFAGALPESEIKKWLAKLVQATGARAPGVEDMGPALAQAAEDLAVGNAERAHAIYSDILEQQPDNVPAFAGLLRCLIAFDALDECEEMIERAPPELQDSKEVATVRTALDLARKAKQSAGKDDELLAALAKNENDHQARFDLALSLYAQGKNEEAIDQLLEIVRRDRKWQEDAARHQLLKLFEALGFDHPDVVQGRKKLSSVLFS